MLDALPQERALPSLPEREKKATPPVREPVPFEWVTLRLVMCLTLIAGLGIAFYYGVMFDTSREGVNNAGLLNDRLAGVLVGGLVAVMAALWFVLQRLADLHQTLKERKDAP